MHAVQISMEFKMCITFLYFLAGLFMQIMNMRCECRLGYPRMMCHSDKIYRLPRFVSMRTSNGLMPIDTFTKLLYANCAVDKIRSKFLKFAPTKHRKRFPRLLLTTSI